MYLSATPNKFPWVKVEIVLVRCNRSLCSLHKEHTKHKQGEVQSSELLYCWLPSWKKFQTRSNNISVYAYCISNFQSVFTGTTINGNRFAVVLTHKSPRANSCQVLCASKLLVLFYCQGNEHQGPIESVFLALNYGTKQNSCRTTQKLSVLPLLCSKNPLCIIYTSLVELDGLPSPKG